MSKLNREKLGYLNNLLIQPLTLLVTRPKLGNLFISYAKILQFMHGCWISCRSDYSHYCGDKAKTRQLIHLPSWSWAIYALSSNEFPIRQPILSLSRRKLGNLFTFCVKSDKAFINVEKITQPDARTKNLRRERKKLTKMRVQTWHIPCGMYLKTLEIYRTTSFHEIKHHSRF